jgi:hypothetical protein
VRLPVVRLPVVRLPVVRLPVVRLPVVRLPVVRLPVVRLPVVRLPVVQLPVVRLPVVRLPWLRSGRLTEFEYGWAPPASAPIRPQRAPRLRSPPVLLFRAVPVQALLVLGVRYCLPNFPHSPAGQA